MPISLSSSFGRDSHAAPGGGRFRSLPARGVGLSWDSAADDDKPAGRGMGRRGGRAAISVIGDEGGVSCSVWGRFSTRVIRESFLTVYRGVPKIFFTVAQLALALRATA